MLFPCHFHAVFGHAHLFSLFSPHLHCDVISMSFPCRFHVVLRLIWSSQFPFSSSFMSFSWHLHTIFISCPCRLYVIFISFSCTEGFLPFGATTNEHDNCNGPMAHMAHFGKSKGEDFDMNLRAIPDRLGIDSTPDIHKTTSVHSENDIGLT